MDEQFKKAQDGFNKEATRMCESLAREIERQQTQINVLKHESKVQGYLFGGDLVLIGVMVCLMIMATFPVS